MSKLHETNISNCFIYSLVYSSSRWYEVKELFKHHSTEKLTVLYTNYWVPLTIKKNETKFFFVFVKQHSKHNNHDIMFSAEFFSEEIQITLNKCVLITTDDSGNTGIEIHLNIYTFHSVRFSRIVKICFSFLLLRNSNVCVEAWIKVLPKFIVIDSECF